MPVFLANQHVCKQSFSRSLVPCELQLLLLVFPPLRSRHPCCLDCQGSKHALEDVAWSICSSTKAETKLRVGAPQHADKHDYVRAKVANHLVTPAPHAMQTVNHRVTNMGGNISVPCELQHLLHFFPPLRSGHASCQDCQGSKHALEDVV